MRYYLDVGKHARNLQINGSQYENIIHYLCVKKKVNGKNICKKYLEKVLEMQPDTEQYLKTWYDTAMGSDWKPQLM